MWRCCSPPCLLHRASPLAFPLCPSPASRPAVCRTEPPTEPANPPTPQSPPHPYPCPCPHLQTCGVHVWFVAHPRQLREWKGGAPNLYDISGSAHFINKADNGVVVHRERDPDAPNNFEVCNILHLICKLFERGGAAQEQGPDAINNFLS